MAFIDLFGEVPLENQQKWHRDPRNPVIAYGETASKEFIGPSSLFERGDDLTLFAEGGEGELETISAYTATRSQARDGLWEPHPDNPILTPAETGFDRGSVFDPAVAEFAGALRLYYSATAGGAHEFAEYGKPGAEAEYIGMAVASASGAFDRHPTPVIEGRCPYVIEWQGVLYLFFVKVVDAGFRIYLARSSDGVEFSPVGDQPVLDVSGHGAWDSFMVTTPKIFRDGDKFTMLYAGDSQRIDDPTGIGIAVSDDLITWRKHPGNPVFVVGEPGQFDNASVASCLAFQVGDEWNILYGGADRSVEEGLHSQIGLARLAWAGPARIVTESLGASTD